MPNKKKPGPSAGTKRNILFYLSKNQTHKKRATEQQQTEQEPTEQETEQEQTEQQKATNRTRD